MPLHADVPAETDILCEHCGYGLNGLPTSGLCPECGSPIADSTTDDGRVLSPWESDGTPTSRFIRTCKAVIFHTATFFRTLQTRPEQDISAAFASQQHTINSILLGLTAVIHADAMGLLDELPGGPLISAAYSPVAILITRFLLGSITRLASSLTRWEGGYWGYRLPAPAVRRVMNFHSAQLLPVAIVALLTVAGYRLLLATNVLSAATGVRYLAVVCIEVLIAAGYLFRTYWIAMKNIMYANR